MYITRVAEISVYIAQNGKQYLFYNLTITIKHFIIVSFILKTENDFNIMIY